MSADRPGEDEHVVQSWFVTAEGGYFTCSCGAHVDVAGYVNDSVEDALARHAAAPIGSSKQVGPT